MATGVPACRPGTPWWLAAAELPGRCRVRGRWGAVMAMADLPLADTLARPLRGLRISVTDRCQFRCTYCMPREVFGRDFVFLPRDQLLTFEELTRLGRHLRRPGGAQAAADWRRAAAAPGSGQAGRDAGRDRWHR